MEFKTLKTVWIAEDLCCTVEDILADGNREVVYFSNINQISRKEIEEY